MSGMTITPALFKILSAWCVVGPFAPSAMMRAEIRERVYVGDLILERGGIRMSQGSSRIFLPSTGVPRKARHGLLLAEVPHEGGKVEPLRVATPPCVAHAPR